jgi:hypothetical protein
VVLSPVAIPDGSGFGASSARQGVANAVSIPAARKMVKIDADNGRHMSGFFVMEVLLFLFDISMRQLVLAE